MAPTIASFHDSGTTTTMATAQVVVKERPDPPGAAVLPQDPSESDEETPFDQRRSPESASFEQNASPANQAARVKPPAAQAEEEEEVSPPAPDDVAAAMRSETPTRAGWLLRSGLPQRRPLQPPSLRGMTERSSTTLESEIQRHWNFWSQLDDDDGPDDEIQARKSQDEEEKKKKRSSMDRTLGHDGDNQSTAEETIDYSAEGKTADGAGDFCGTTLNAINEMCGTGLEQTRSTEETKSRKVPTKSDDQQEYTAIEVEFVEANAPSKREAPDDESPTVGDTPVDVLSDGDEDKEEAPSGKKTAFLSALARKAKADFDKAKSERKKMEKHQAIESKRSTDSVDEDIYTAFSASEKRKFLKLINTGHAPMDASRKIMEARAEKEKVAEAKKQQAELRKNRRNKRLAFWKKNRPNATTAMPAPSYSRSTDEAEAAEEPVYEDDEPEEEVDAASETEEEGAISSDELIPDAAMSAMIALDAKAPRSISPPAPTLEDIEDKDKQASTGKQTDGERFARSGINYYDAVRRETSDTDDDVARIETSRAVGSAEKKKRRPRPRGFSYLREGVRSKSVPKPRVPEPVFEEEEQKANQSRKVEIPTIEPAKSSDPVLQTTPRGYATPSPPPPPTVKNEQTSSSLPAPMRLDLGIPLKEETSAAKTKASQGDSRSRNRVVADVGKSKTKIGKKDEEMLARIEKEILRTASPTSESPVQKRSMSTPKMRPPGGSELLTKEEKKQTELSPEVDIDTYMQAADVYSAQDSVTPHNDATSVYTAATGATGYTQSRKRRPGAARNRLAKAKELYEMESAKKKGLGWHESIQAAAEGTGRVWKPGTGWVDYVDDAAGEQVQTAGSGDKLELNLKKVLSKKSSDETEPPESSVVPVPFPKDWEAERQEMLAAGEASPSKWPMNLSTESSPQRALTVDDFTIPTTGIYTVSAEERKPVTPVREPLDGPLDVLADAPPTPFEQDETPKSLRIGDRIKRMRKKSSPAKTRMTSNDEKPSGWLASMQAATAALGDDGKSWDVENGWNVPEAEQRLISDVVDFNTTSSTGESRQIAVDVLRESPPPSGPYSPRGPDGKLTQWVEKSGKVANVGSSAADMSASERAVASNASAGSASKDPRITRLGGGTTHVDPYVQISDTGSVRAHKTPTGEKAPTQRISQSGDDEARSPGDRLGAFPTANDLPASAIVDIQKIDEEDLNLFPEETREKRVDRGYISPARTPPRVKSPGMGVGTPPQVSGTSSGGSSRRGGGPIDADEVDNTWDSDDEQRFSLGWDSRSGSASAQSKPTPASTRAIPKLRGSKRDTSPIRARQLMERPGPESDVLSDISASKPDIPDKDWRRISARGADVKARTKEWETRAMDGPPEWPDEGDDVSREHRDRPASEWKSFLGKKVNAETAVASQQREQGQGIQGVRSEDEDSLFQFEDKKLPSNSLRELRKEGVLPNEAQMHSRERFIEGDDRPGSDIYGSEGYGPTPQDGRTFLQRLTECAAPVVASARDKVGPMIDNARDRVNELPSAHLAFMKNGQFSPAKMGCGKGDDVNDKEEDLDESQASDSIKKETPRSKSTPRSIPTSRSPKAPSSVGSDGFGAKTAYLEAIAMKAAVSKPRRTSSSRGDSSVASSSVTSEHSEKWKSFLERKKTSGASPAKGRSASHVSDVSKAAERYTAAKVDEIMAEMKTDQAVSASVKEEMITESTYFDDIDDDYRALRSYRARDSRGESRVGAAEDLAAARVEAMMSQLSGNQELEEAEI